RAFGSIRSALGNHWGGRAVRPENEISHFQITHRSPSVGGWDRSVHAQLFSVLLCGADVATAILPEAVFRTACPIEPSKRVAAPSLKLVAERRIEHILIKALDLTGAALWLPVRSLLAPRVRVAIGARRGTIVSHTGSCPRAPKSARSAKSSADESA